ncbi:MAG: TonB-dependent receptor [Oceanicaulis sp.]
MINKVFLLAALASISDGRAEVQPETDDAPIIVLGSRLSEPAGTLRTPDPIGAALPPTALDVLATVPDVRAISTGGAGGTRFVSIRGAEPNFAQVLIDGVRVSNPSSSQGGGFDFAQLDPGLIESLAVAPASRSAVHGADALSGVLSVRLIDAPSQGVSGGLTAAADTAEGHALTARLGAGLGQGGVLISAGASDTGDLTEGSTLERRQALARVTRTFNSWDASAFLLYGETERGAFPESSGGPAFAANRERERRDTRALIAGLGVSGPEALRVRPSMRLGYYDDTVVADTPAIFPGVFDPVPALSSDTDFKRFEATADVRVRLTDALGLVAGASLQEERADSTGVIDLGFPLPTGFSIDRDQTSLFAEAQWRPGSGLTVSLAARRDAFEEDTEVTAQSSVQYAPPGSRWTVFAGYAEGFRRPSLFALAFPLTANPDLRPERSVSWEGGLVWAGDTARWRASVYRNDYTDLIDFDPVLFTTVNRAETVIQGASISGEGELGDALDWSASFTALDFDSAAPLRGRPDWYGQARLIWRPVQQWRAGAAARFSADFTDSSIPTGFVELDGHFAVDIFGEWRPRETVAISLAVRNALDEDWSDAVGFPAPGRVVRLQTALTY